MIHTHQFSDIAIVLERILADCQDAFDCRKLNPKDSYSLGSTYFIPINATPNCGLEKFAQQIFLYHASASNLIFDPEKSGSEWWTQVIDIRDDIGFHWDRDYGLEERNGSCMYPKVATVTYLTDSGGPTIVMEKVGSVQADSDISDSLSTCFVSAPNIGKHLSFDGPLFHAAPSDLLHHDASTSESENESDEDSEDNSDDSHPRRITFLVNLWVNHIPESCSRYSPPVDSSPLPSSTSFIPTTASESETSRQPPVVHEVSSRDTPQLRWKFHHGVSKYAVTMPAFSEDEEREVMGKAKEVVVKLVFENEEGIRIEKVDDSDDDEEEEDDDGDDDDDDDDDNDKGEEEDREEEKVEDRAQEADARKNNSMIQIERSQKKRRL